MPAARLFRPESKRRRRARRSLHPSYLEDFLLDQLDRDGFDSPEFVGVFADAQSEEIALAPTN